MTQRLHMVGNAHIDPVWLWQWPEGYQEVRATFRSALERMEEFPEFVFTMNAVCYLAWVEESDPELFERIRARIADGRWQVVGGWWIEPDCNIPGGESFVRQALYGQRYLHDRFGITATTGANVDSFGHNAMIPQILRGAGMDSYVFLRPSANERELPASLFAWEARDGSRVTAYRIPHEYCSPRGELVEHVEKALEQLPRDADELMVFYGVGDHGGGPTKANLESIRALDGQDGRRLECSSPRAFFDAVGNGELPVVRGDLLNHAVGCYAAHSGIKRWNRRAEHLLQRAEKWCAVAAEVAGVPYPLADLTEAWKLLLFNQFHDTLAGTSIKPAYEDARDQVGHASSLAAAAFNRAVQSIAGAVDIPDEPDVRAVVVFNPHPWPVEAEVELEFTWLEPEGVRMTDDEGAAVPVQTTRPLATASRSRGRLVFPVSLPPLGYRVHAVHPGAEEQPAGVTATGTTLENEHLALEVDPATGWLSRLRDERTGAELAGDGAHAVVVEDRSDTWGHGIRAYDEVVGAFACTSVRLLEHGPVRSVLRIESRYGDSTLAEELILRPGARSVEVRAVLDWRERLKLLKLRVPTTIAADVATFEIPYGYSERPADGTEQPAQAWVDVSSDGAGLAVLNDGKCGHDVRGGDIGITVARSPVYAWHDPKELEADGVYDYLDQGIQELTYRLVPHAGDWRDAGVVEAAAELNQPPFALLEASHPGARPRRASFMSVGGVIGTVLKGAEDGGANVVRAYECSGRPARARVTLFGRTIDADFGPAEIKTFVVPRDPAQPAVETNLLEWPR
jgi:alpha-mannosidase